MKIRNERGSVTLFVLIAMLFFNVYGWIIYNECKILKVVKLQKLLE